MQFVSLVGMQTMALLNPLMAVSRQFKAPDSIHLLCTKKAKVQENAKRIADLLGSDKCFEHSNLQKHNCSSTLLPDKAGDLAPSQILPTILKDDDLILFNLAGGLKFQMVDTLLGVLERPNIMLLYPETDCIHAFQIRNGVQRAPVKCPLPGPMDVLALQGIDYEAVDNGNDFLEVAFKRGIQPPKGSKRNIKIGGILFDLMWNEGNTLKFVKIVEKSADARELLGLAGGRNEFGELYHRDIHVLTPNDAVKNRIEAEGRGKASSHQCNIHSWSALPSALLQAIVPPANNVSVTATSQQFRTPHDSKSDTALVTVLNTDIMSTQMVLWSHQPKSVYVLYTPQDQDVVKVKNALIEHLDLLPVENLHFLPISFTGHDILNINMPNETHVAVNVTPGNKSQSAFLAQWARQHKVPIFSINAAQQTVSQIPSGKTFPVQAADPLTLLKLHGYEMYDSGYGKNSLLKDRPLFEKLIQFIQIISADKEVFKQFPEGDIDFNGAVLKRYSEHRQEMFLPNDKRVVKLDMSANKWFERLVGFMMLECGADDAQVHMRTKWRDETVSTMKKMPSGMETQMTDYDVVARFGSQYYLIECKTGKIHSVTQKTEDVSNVAQTLGRFTVPMICFLKYMHEPDNQFSNVYRFGFRTLFDKNALNHLRMTALRSRQHTVE